MFILDWYREWLSIRSEASRIQRELTSGDKICESCETLKTQLEIANYEKEKLLNRLLVPPAKEPERNEAPPLQAVRPRTVPWNVRRQMLETEDREKARLMNLAPKPSSETPIKVTEEGKVDVADLEKEMDIAGAERERQSIQSN